MYSTHLKIIGHQEINRAQGPPVLLIHPPSNMERPQLSPRFPTNLTSLAAHLLGQGIRVQILDLVTEVEGWQAVRNRISEALKCDPLVIGLAVSLSDFRYEAMHVAKIIKELAPDIFLVVGGQHASALPGQMIEYFHADAVVMGEGEETLKELALALKSGTSLNAIAGLCLPHNGQPILTGHRNKIRDLSTLFVPAHDILDGFEAYLTMQLNDPFSLWKSHKDFNLSVRMIQILGSRGCPNACTFCSSNAFWGKGVRMRPISDIVDEIDYWHKAYGIVFFRIDDDTLTLNEHRIITFCEMLDERGLDIEWEAQTRIDMITEPMMAALAGSGCVSLGFGIESGSERMRKVLRKGFSISQGKMIENLRMARSSGVPIAIYLLVGTPGENDDTIQESIELVETVQPHYVSPVRIEIRPGTELFRYACEHYRIDNDIWVKGPVIVHNTYEKTDVTLRHYMFEIRKAWIESMDADFRQRVVPMIHALESYYKVDFELKQSSAHD